MDCIVSSICSFSILNIGFNIFPNNALNLLLFFILFFTTLSVHMYSISSLYREISLFEDDCNFSQLKSKSYHCSFNHLFYLHLFHTIFHKILIEMVNNDFLKLAEISYFVQNNAYRQMELKTDVCYRNH